MEIVNRFLVPFITSQVAERLSLLVAILLPRKLKQCCKVAMFVNGIAKEAKAMHRNTHAPPFDVQEWTNFEGKIVNTAKIGAAGST